MTYIKAFEYRLPGLAALEWKVRALYSICLELRYHI